jgi:hypothetical protein
LAIDSGVDEEEVEGAAAARMGGLVKREETKEEEDEDEEEVDKENITSSLLTPMLTGCGICWVSVSSSSSVSPSA